MTMATPLSVLMVLEPEKRNGTKGLKLGKQTQLDSSNNMGLVPSSHTFSSVCKAKNVNKKQNKKHLDQGSYTHELRLIQILIDKSGKKKRGGGGGGSFQAN